MFFLNSFINNNLTLNTPVQKKRRLHIAFFRTDHYLLNNDGNHGVVRDDGGDDGGDAEVVVEAHNDNHDTDDNNSEMVVEASLHKELGSQLPEEKQLPAPQQQDGHMKVLRINQSLLAQLIRKHLHWPEYKNIMPIQMKLTSFLTILILT